MSQPAHILHALSSLLLDTVLTTVQRLWYAVQDLALCDLIRLHTKPRRNDSGKKLS